MFRCFRNARGILLLLAAVAVAAYLVIWHGAHLAAALPILLLLACPLLHLFMHGGHGGHGGHGQHGSAADATPKQDGERT
jgi:hypothetical protein